MRSGKRNRQRRSTAWLFLAGAALGFFAPWTAVLAVCGAVLVLSFMGKL